jgi:hypothetical protein
MSIHVCKVHKCSKAVREQSKMQSSSPILNGDFSIVTDEEERECEVSGVATLDGATAYNYDW